MSVILQDLQRLQEDTESTISQELSDKAPRGRFAMSSGIRRPSSFLICCLSALCIGLLFIVIIILGVILTRQGMDQTRQNMEVMYRNLSVGTHSGVEQLSKNDSRIMETLAAIEIFMKDLKAGQRLDQMEQNMEEKFKTLMMGVNAITERLSPDGSLSSNIQSVLGAVRKLEEDTRNANTSLSSDIQRILGGLGRVAEEVRKMNSSAGPICSTGWTQYGLSCYYLSSNSQRWNASKKDCEDRKAHLVVINDEGEMKFLRRFLKVNDVWIGLSDANGTWRWVDGTSYDKTPKFWEDNQPDDWEGHGLGGGEDCVELRNRDEWNDDHCSKSFQYICEKKIF